MKNNFKKIIPVSLFLLPILTSAQLDGTDKFFGKAKSIVSDTLVPGAFFVALVYFFYGIAKYIKSEGAGKAEGKMIMVWGVVALFVASSVWGLVTLLQKEIGINSNPGSMKIPTLETYR